MTLRYTILALFCVLCQLTMARGVALSVDTEPDTLYDKFARGPMEGDWVLKFTPLALLEYQTVVQFGFEYSFDDRHSLTGDLGYVFMIDPEWELTSSYALRGFRLRHGLRRYTKSGRTFFELEGGTKQLWTYRFQSVGFECEDNACNWFEDRDFLVRRSKVTGHLKVGIRSATPKPLTFETWFGAGLLVVNSHPVGLPENAEVELVDPLLRRALFNVDRLTGTQVWPSFTMGVKICYRLNNHP